MVRTRIAPSPTGFPHIGTVYQALFDYAFAHKYDGQFLVRIEDTDRGRFVEGAEDAIFSALDWFGLSEDESPRKAGPHAPYRQSERLEIYQKHAEDLLEKEHAYYCFCSKERLEEVRNKMQAEKKIPMYDRHCRNISLADAKARIQAGETAVIRMKIPDNEKIVVPDGIRGDVIFDSSVVDDQVIVKTDGFPTYHLAVVVDDHTMEVTHVLRGEEWLSSAPKHILLYQYFGWTAPEFFHTPLIRNPDKSKLSKRQGHTSVTWYKEHGFLPEAILNYLALMGWTHPEEKDIFAFEEFIKLFEFKDLKPLGPVFDLKKLEWMNGQYIMAMQPETLKQHILDFNKDVQLDEAIVEKSIPLVRERMKTLPDYLAIAQFLFTRPTTYEKDLTESKELLMKVHTKLATVESWQAEVIGDAMVSLAGELGVSNSQFFMTLRVAISGNKITPPLNDSMELLGKDECLARLEIAAKQ
ncbi:MAG: glutamate--tRNA ligase [Weeksellaceae bacterium]